MCGVCSPYRCCQGDKLAGPHRYILSRPSKRCIWTKPDSPVFYALTRGQHLDFSNSAPIDQQRRFLRHAADLVGMLNTPVSHDLRKGGAADIYAIKSNVVKGDIERVRRSLGHLNLATSKRPRRHVYRSRQGQLGPSGSIRRQRPSKILTF